MVHQRDLTVVSNVVFRGNDQECPSLQLCSTQSPASTRDVYRLHHDSTICWSGVSNHGQYLLHPMVVFSLFVGIELRRVGRRSLQTLRQALFIILLECHVGAVDDLQHVGRLHVVGPFHLLGFYHSWGSVLKCEIGWL